MKTYGGHCSRLDINSQVDYGQDVKVRAVTDYLHSSRTERYRTEQLRSLLREIVPDYTKKMDPTQFTTHNTESFLYRIIAELCLDELEEVCDVLINEGSDQAIEKLIKLY